MRSYTKKTQSTDRPGWTIIESILTIGIAAMMGLIVINVVGVTKTNARAIHRLQAAVVADEELSALKRLDITTMTDQANGPPLNVLPNAGTWTVTQDATNLDLASSPCPPQTISKHCGPNVLNLRGGAAFANTLNGRLLLPADAYGDTTIQANWKVVSDSPSNWVIGLYLRARDPNNGYRLRIGSASVDFVAGGQINNVILEKLVNGTPTTMYVSAGPITFFTNTWFAIKVVMSGNTIAVYKDGTLFSGASVTDATNPWSDGQMALAGWNGVHAQVDDVTEVDPASCTSTPSKCWNFESTNVLPNAWTRFGMNDLPDATPFIFDDAMSVTLEPWPAGANDMKKATITVTWIDADQTASMTTTGYLRKNSLGL